MYQPEKLKAREERAEIDSKANRRSIRCKLSSLFCLGTRKKNHQEKKETSRADSKCAKRLFLRR